MPRLAPARSTGAEPQPARPEARPAPEEGRPARPKWAQRSAAAPLLREAGPNLPRRVLTVPGAWRALVDPMLEPADSKMSRSQRQAGQAVAEVKLEVQSEPPDRPTTARVRRGLPT